jgi:hypothetical protein
MSRTGYTEKGEKGEKDINFQFSFIIKLNGIE